MVEMSAQEMQDFAKTLAPSADLDGLQVGGQLKRQEGAQSRI